MKIILPFSALSQLREVWQLSSLLSQVLKKLFFFICPIRFYLIWLPFCKYVFEGFNPNYRCQVSQCEASNITSLTYFQNEVREGSKDVLLMMMSSRCRKILPCLVCSWWLMIVGWYFIVDDINQISESPALPGWYNNTISLADRCKLPKVCSN